MAHSISELLGSLGEQLAEEIRHCEKHGDYQALLLGSGKSRPATWTVCEPCREEERQERWRQEQIEMRAKFERDSLARKIGRACIPLRFAERTFANYSAISEEQQKALRICREYADGFEDNLRLGRSILMLGNVGTGKTHLAAAIGNQILNETKFSVLYATASGVIRHVKNSFDKESEHTESQAYETFAKPGLLILDEIGVQNATDFELTVMFEVINRRYEDLMPTMVISNRGIKDLPRFLGDRVVDRLRENGGKLVVFDWNSERKNIKGDGDD